MGYTPVPPQNTGILVTVSAKISIICTFTIFLIFSALSTVLMYSKFSAESS